MSHKVKMICILAAILASRNTGPVIVENCVKDSLRLYEAVEKAVVNDGSL